MHKLIRIDEAMATRFLVLKNLETGIVERCFDDTPWLSDDNFEFMLVNQEYNCKIKLFGDAVEEKTEDSVLCKVIDKNVRRVITITTYIEYYKAGGYKFCLLLHYIIRWGK